MRLALMPFAALLVGACASEQGNPAAAYGTDPEIAEPAGGGLFPTVHTADPIGWDQSEAPTAPSGFTVTRFAEGLAHPRWVYVLPNGDVLVAESATQPAKGGGLMGWIKNQIQRGAGAIVESANRITLLRDADDDGVAEMQAPFVEGLNQPFGMVLVGDYFYVGNTDAVVRFAYTEGATSLSGAPETVLELPYHADSNGHWTRTLLASADGSKLYVAVGSVSNIPEKPDAFALEEGRAAIWEFNPDGSGARIFASGLRNPVGTDWNPANDTLWVAVNERDMLGDALPPDYITSVRDGGFYGWPYAYWGQHVDERVKPAQPDLVAQSITPDYALGPHTASLGFTFYDGASFPARYQGGAFVGQHGSWNASELIGYKVVFVPFSQGAPSGAVEDFLTGFLNERGDARGRPVGVTVDPSGALLVADDVGDIVWRVSASQ